jgi:hypothetical protein
VNVKSKIAVGVLVLASVGGGGFVVARQITERAGEAEFQKQLRLARLEGLPTTVAEYEATLPQINPEENAAPIYMKLAALKSGWPARDALDKSILYEPTKENRATAKDALRDAKAALILIEAATAKPNCRFESDWSQGPRILLTEFASMKNAAKVLLVRAQLSAVEGDSASALSDAEAILRIAGHLDDQSDLMSYLTGESIRQIGLSLLAMLAVQFPDQQAYRQGLEDAVTEWEVPLLKPLFRGELVEIFSVIELVEKEKSTVAGQTAPVQLPLAARVEVVKAARLRWASFDSPPSSRKRMARQAHQNLLRALEPIPALVDVYDVENNDFSEYDVLLPSATRRVAYKALLRALEQPTLPKTIKTDDLLSPFDKKPVTYKYDKGRILIELSKSASGYQPYRLEIGPPAKSAP